MGNRVHYWKKTEGYKVIKDFYADKVASRSQVPLMNHIDEGLIILNHINASDKAAIAFCLHPLLQSDEQLADTTERNLLKNCDKESISFAMEYRRIANSYLCRPATDNWNIQMMRKALLPMSDEVRDMLIADKVQNRKDFMMYHVSTHERSPELRRYFDNWLELLGSLRDEYLMEFDLLLSQDS